MSDNAVIKTNVIIIGGGPAGLFAAARLKKNTSALLLEKNDSPGRKLLLSGSGHCNFTHAGDIENFFHHYGHNHRFLRPALTAFSNAHLIRFMTERGLRITTDKNGKVFPLSGNSRDVLDVLMAELAKNRTRFRSNEPATDIEKTEQGFRIQTASGKYDCTAVIIATGGKSYPASGSTGDGYGFAQKMGHALTPPKPALTPVFIRDYRFADISGVSLENRLIRLYRDNRKIAEHRGDIGFTHKGLSGPGILDFSRYMEKNDVLKINLIDLSDDQLTAALEQGRRDEGRVSVKRFLKRFVLPESLIRIILTELEAKESETLAVLGRKHRMDLVEFFCSYPFHIDNLGSFKMAMATTGGVSLKDVSGKTMESRLTPGLYFAGEVLDIDGDTGGYNLQAAFSTAFLAAESLNRRE